jgi:hypothetical protein
VTDHIWDTRPARPPTFGSAPHDPTDACRGWHCFFHGVDEDFGTDDEAVGITCGECGHLYTSGQAIVDAYMQDTELVSGGPPRWTDITFCPLCLHDW